MDDFQGRVKAIVDGAVERAAEMVRTSALAS
jgi:hypothetical protein